MTSPVQFGIQRPWKGAIARRNPERRLEQYKKETLATQQNVSAQAVYQALGKTLFTDKHGAFRGWDLLLLLKKSGDTSGDVSKASFKARFSNLDCKHDVENLLQEFANLGLTGGPYSTYWRLTDRGHQSLKLFKKEFKKPGPLGKLGNYSFSKK